MERTNQRTSRQVADWGWSGVTSGIRAWSLKVFLEIEKAEVNKGQRTIKKETPRQVADCGWSGVTSGIRAWSLEVFLQVRVQVNRREREHLDNCGRMGLVWSYSTRSDRAWSLMGLVWSYSGDRAWSLKALLEMQNKKEK